MAALLCIVLASHEGQGSYCVSTDCTIGYGRLSLYLRVCCVVSNLGQTVTIRETGINRYILCPKVLPKSCPGKLLLLLLLLLLPIHSCK